MATATEAGLGPGGGRRPARSPQWLDARTLAMHRLIAAKLRSDPALFAKVRDNLARWHPRATPGNLVYLDAWQTLVDQGLEACLTVALEQSERGNAMRQSSPFAGLLSNRERWDFLRAWEGHEAR